MAGDPPPLQTAARHGHIDFRFQVSFRTAHFVWEAPIKLRDRPSHWALFTCRSCQSPV
jgi:hypothetical protein